MGACLFTLRKNASDRPSYSSGQQSGNELVYIGGEYYEIYEALIKAWCLQMHLPTDDETVSKYFRLNLERGIAHLCGTGFIKSTDDLIRLAIK